MFQSAQHTHIAALLKTPYGIQAARLWVVAWAQGSVPQHIANLWLIGQVKPLSKKSGSGVRPITLFEMLLKLATGVVLDVSKADIINAVGPYQYGALMECGADRMVYNLRAMALAAPHKLFIATDIQNAYGTVNRSTAIGALLMHLPCFVPIMSLFWGAAHTSLYVPDSHSSFAQLKVTQGVFQGECLSTPVFCTHLRAAIDHFLHHAALAFPDGDPNSLVQILAYVDDVVLIIDPPDFSTLWPIWVESLRKYGLLVEQSKCKAWVPSMISPLPEAVKVFGRDNVSTSGLTVLGSAASGSHKTTISLPSHPTPISILLAEAHARYTTASQDAQLLKDMVTTSCEQPTRYAAWLMLVRSLAVRLDFDMRILPSSVLAPLICDFTQTLITTAQTIIGIGDLSTLSIEQLQLPGHQGGLFLTNPIVKLQVAHLSSLAASWRHTFNWLQRCGIDECTAFSSIPTKEAQLSLDHLSSLNIFITPFGSICNSNYPGDKLSFRVPLLGQIRTLQGRLTNAIFEIHAQELWYQLPPTAQARFLSCGGIGNGLCWRSPTKQTRLHFDDWEFQICCAIRLGHAFKLPAKCANKSLGGTPCGCDNSLFHPLSCKIGGGVSFLHTAICTQITKITKEAGLRVHREVPIPEFTSSSSKSPTQVFGDDDLDPLEAQNFKDAVMDVMAVAPTGEEFLIDASIRNPLAQRYSDSAFSQPGRAANLGEFDKKARYPVAQGKAVLPCVIESFGRLGNDFLSFLEHLAYLSSSIRECEGARPSHLKSTWLLDISATLNKAIAKNYRMSCSGSHAITIQLPSLFPPPPLAPPSFLSTRLQGSPLSATLHNRHHILSTFLPPSTLPTHAVHPDLRVIGSTISSTKHTKPATPKRNSIGEDLVEDIPTGITGLEATSTTSLSHPLPLFHSIGIQIASRRLATAITAAGSPVTPSPIATGPALCSNHNISITAPSLSTSHFAAGHVAHAEGTLSHPCPAIAGVASVPLSSLVSPAASCLSPSPLITVSPGSADPSSLITVVSPSLTVAT